MGVVIALSKEREETIFNFQHCLSLFKDVLVKQSHLSNTLQSIITLCESTLSKTANGNFAEELNSFENEKFFIEDMEENYKDYNGAVDLIEDMEEDYENYNYVVDLDNESDDD
jgi:hypothetical protein